ncbi:hypothetical protein C8R41DRAFT_816494 [Lentinula lateritia]|uniref:NADAR domain-containing protein n=1 Tax=Lentinula lateritia TaxID=40482 RepID=A0ABQ8VR12_9AGAR|nr:hypothetical protein C8R41DRAFT_816494 [Lentinula lateritia]
MPSIVVTRASPTTIVPHSSGHSSHSSLSSASTQDGTKEYRVELEERRRRTVFVTSSVPPEQWETREILDIANIEEENEKIFEGDFSATVHRNSTRSRSAQDLPSNDKTQHRHSPQTSSRYQSRRASLKPSDALSSAAATLNRMSVMPNTPPNSPAVWKPNHSIARTNLSPNAHGPRPTTMAVAIAPRPQVLFYHKHHPHYGFTNFSPHPVIYKGKRYPSSEHLFQSFKFHGHRPLIAEHIRTCGERPSIAFSEARRFQSEVRPDWKKINVEKMDVALYHKFTQHPDLMNELLATGNAELVEDSDKDAFWGIGADHRGRNELGKALERLREQFRAD